MGGVPKSIFKGAGVPASWSIACSDNGGTAKPMLAAGGNNVTLGGGDPTVGSIGPWLTAGVGPAVDTGCGICCTMPPGGDCGGPTVATGCGGEVCCGAGCLRTRPSALIWTNSSATIAEMGGTAEVVAPGTATCGILPGSGAVTSACPVASAGGACLVRVPLRIKECREAAARFFLAGGILFPSKEKKTI